MKEYEFVIGIAPDEETIKEFHKVLANGLIKKYGVETMKEVVRRIAEKERDTPK